MKRLYKVLGIVKSGYKIEKYILGFTNSKSAWLRNPNGWKSKDLEFI